MGWQRAERRDSGASGAVSQATVRSCRSPRHLHGLDDLQLVHLCLYGPSKHACAPIQRILTRSNPQTRTLVDGVLIYKQLGPDAESQFANQWGVGYAMDKCVAGSLRICCAESADKNPSRPLQCI